jgi:hypothetical protein
MRGPGIIFIQVARRREPAGKAMLAPSSEMRHLILTDTGKVITKPQRCLRLVDEKASFLLLYGTVSVQCPQQALA